MPLFIFPILFGPSTDCEVFLISRIREEYNVGVDTRKASAGGLSHTARVITAAAVMVTVFLSDPANTDGAVKQYGLGLGVAVLPDATIVRMVLVPSLMELLAAANWWLPHHRNACCQTVYGRFLVADTIFSSWRVQPSHGRMRTAHG